MAEKKNPTFEQAMTELAEIVAKLEQGELPLEESMKLYERGVALTAWCERQLKSAKLRVEELKKPQDE